MYWYTPRRPVGSHVYGIKSLTTLVFVCLLFPTPDFWRNSTIITGNALYKSRLHEFLTPAVGSIPRWMLCYRASNHGWAASTFHGRCDRKRDTVTIIKRGQYVFGRYTDIPWCKQSIPYQLFFCMSLNSAPSQTTKKNRFNVSPLYLSVVLFKHEGRGVERALTEFEVFNFSSIESILIKLRLVPKNIGSQCVHVWLTSNNDNGK